MCTWYQDKDKQMLLILVQRKRVTVLENCKIFTPQKLGNGAEKLLLFSPVVPSGGILLA